GRSRFSLSTLPASDFPGVEQGKNGQQFELKQGDLKRLIDRTSFAMAQQDVRYYLNGMLFEVSQDLLRAVATDGHRLAMATFEGAVAVEQDAQVIVPRKGVVELARLLIHEDEPASLIVGTNHIRVATRGFTFTSKLIDGKFPDYERVLPRGTTKTVIGSREELKQAFARAAILSNEKYRGIRMLLANGALTITANNPEQEEAEETVAVDYEGPGLEIGFNVSYILDVLGVVSGEEVKFLLSDANSSALIEDAVEGDCQYVVMPMRL
ncbi:MAG: DNA polymerase III subunit beta, partial [Spongiibacteraceae bacterium]